MLKPDLCLALEIRLVPCSIPLQSHLVPLFPSHRSKPIRSTRTSNCASIQEQSEEARRNSERMGQIVGPFLKLAIKIHGVVTRYTNPKD
jgi:hypothetical protein